MKYIVVWDNDGGCVSFALEENPRFEYDVDAMLVNCITSKQRVDIPLNEIHKYILDVNPGIPASIDEAVSEENKMSYGGDVIFLNDFTPDTDVLVFTEDGVITARYKTDVNGCLVISTEGWTSGVHVIKANKVSYKIYKK